MSTSTKFKFTEATLQSLQPASKRYKVFDTELPAFGVRIEPSGRKTFQLSFRVNRRLREASLGKVGIVSLAAARRKAIAMLGSVAEGRDPLGNRDAARRGSVADAARSWLKDYVVVRRKPATVRNYKLAVDGHIIPGLGSIPISELGTPDVQRLHSRLRATPYLANRVLAALSSLCTWCEKVGLRDVRSNPCLLVERYPEVGHKRYLTTKEYARLGQAIDRAEDEGTASPAALLAIRLLLLTGCRPSEVCSLRWNEVDFRTGTLRLADSKTGAKTVFLSRKAVTLLKQWPVIDGSPYVFPGTGRRTRGVHLVNLSKPWLAIRRSAALDGVRLYDAVRHSFASVAISQHGHGLGVVGELLGHSQAATTKRYAHLHDDVARRAAAAVGLSISRALSSGRRR